MVNAYTYSNTAIQTTLSGSISNVALTITVAATTGFPVAFPYVLALDYGGPAEELVTVTAAAGTTLTIGTRGFGGTSAQSHSLGAVVRHVYNAVDATDFRTHEAATAAVHGVAGTIVGTTDSQTLTNKTLTAPAISNPTITGGGSWAGSPTITGATLNTASIPSPSITGTVAGGASYTAPTITSPTISGTVGGSATYSTPTLRDATGVNSAIGVVPVTVNAIAGTTANLIDVQLNGTSRLNVSSVGRLTVAPANTATKGALVNAASGFVGNLLEGQLNAVSKFSVTEAGNTTYTGTLTGGSAGQLTFDASGNLTAAGNITAGAWNSFTPTWTATTTNPTLGNGTLTSRWSRVGRTITWQGSLVCGSTTTGGTGTWQMSLPVAAATSIPSLGAAEYVHIGDNEYVGIVRFDNAAPTVVTFTVKGSTNSAQFSSVTQAFPVATDQNVRLTWTWIYEAAS